jgi:hypothetical protein
VEVVNKSLKTILQRTINFSQVKLAFDVILEHYGPTKHLLRLQSFSHLSQLIYGLEVILPIECQIPSLKLAVQLLLDTSPIEEWLVHLEQLVEQHHDAALANKAHKHKFKC